MGTDDGMAMMEMEMILLPFPSEVDVIENIRCGKLYRHLALLAPLLYFKKNVFYG